MVPVIPCVCPVPGGRCQWKAPHIPAGWLAPTVPPSDAMHGKGDVPSLHGRPPDPQGDVPVCMAEPLVPLHFPSVPHPMRNCPCPCPCPTRCWRMPMHGTHFMPCPCPPLPGAGACLQVIDDCGDRLARELGAFLHEQLLQRLHCRGVLSSAEGSRRTANVRWIPLLDYRYRYLRPKSDSIQSKYCDITAIKDFDCCFTKRWPLCMREYCRTTVCPLLYTRRADPISDRAIDRDICIELPSSCDPPEWDSDLAWRSCCCMGDRSAVRPRRWQQPHGATWEHHRPSPPSPPPLVERHCCHRNPPLPRHRPCIRRRQAHPPTVMWRKPMSHPGSLISGL